MAITLRSPIYAAALPARLPYEHTQVDGRAAGRLVHRVAAVKPLEHPQPDVHRVERAASVPGYVMAVGGLSNTARQHTRFERRLAEAVHNIMNEREAVVRERAHFNQLQPGTPHRPDQLVVRAQPHMVGPDPRQHAVLDVRAEQRLQSLVDRVPPEG